MCTAPQSLLGLLCEHTLTPVQWRELPAECAGLIPPVFTLPPFKPNSLLSPLQHHKGSKSPYSRNYTLTTHLAQTSHTDHTVLQLFSPQLADRTQFPADSLTNHFLISPCGSFPYPLHLSMLS